MDERVEGWMGFYLNGWTGGWFGDSVICYLASSSSLGKHLINDRLSEGAGGYVSN